MTPAGHAGKCEHETFSKVPTFKSYDSVLLLSRAYLLTIQDLDCFFSFRIHKCTLWALSAITLLPISSSTTVSRHRTSSYPGFSRTSVPGCFRATNSRPLPWGSFLLLGKLLPFANEKAKFKEVGWFRQGSGRTRCNQLKVLPAQLLRC